MHSKFNCITVNFDRIRIRICYIYFTFKKWLCYVKDATIVSNPQPNDTVIGDLTFKNSQHSLIRAQIKGLQGGPQGGLQGKINRIIFTSTKYWDWTGAPRPMPTLYIE